MVAARGPAAFWLWLVAVLIVGNFTIIGPTRSGVMVESIYLCVHLTRIPTLAGHPQISTGGHPHG